MNRVNILFLSDLHFTQTIDETYAQDIEECAKRYVDFVGAIGNGWKPQIVAIAGDIGYYGTAEDYKFFKEKFLLPLMESLEISVDHIIMCPGNHDKDDSYLLFEETRFNIKELDENPAVQSSFKNFVYAGYRADCKKQFILNSDAVEPFDNYIKFLQEMGIPAFDITKYDYKEDAAKAEGCEYLYGYRCIEGIDFYCYNSAWDCFHYDKKDKGNLRIGPVKNSTTEDDHKLAISLVHHPYDWLSVDDVSGIKFRHAIIVDEATLAVHGHMHTSNMWWNAAGKVLLVQLPTWSSQDTDFECWKSYIFNIDLDDLSCSHKILFWHRDNGDAYVTIAGGEERYDLKLAQKLESLRDTSFKTLGILHSLLLDCLDEFMRCPDENSLKKIIALLDGILEIVGKLAIDMTLENEVVNNMRVFYSMANNKIVLKTSEEITYDQLTNFAERIKTSMAMSKENPRTRTRHRDN